MIWGVKCIRCERNCRKCQNKVSEVQLSLMEGQPRGVSESGNNDMYEIELSGIDLFDSSGFVEAELLGSNVENLLLLIASEFDVAKLLKTTGSE